jgi:hypothetical protein
MKKENYLPKSLNLEELRGNLDFIVSSMSAYMCDCLIVCFKEENHSSGLVMKVETEAKQYSYKLHWTTPVTRYLIGATQDTERTTEWAAMGLALLFARELTDYPYICTRRKGEGVDFCLSKNSQEFSCDARLEVSGIRKESPKNTIEGRLRIKKRQTERSDDKNTPVFISITEFSEPKSLFVKND